jgi:beta-phosphoglucomutase-like phosphatase (HAD superfamily)
MSNDNTVDSAIEAPIAETVGQAEVSTEIGEAPEVSTDYFAWDEYADKPVKLNVAGEEIDVPLKEALAGYQRQADYTRKTQELSEQRKQVQFGAALQEALQNDPKSTLELLKQHYGLEEQQSSEDELLLDPVEKQYRQLESRMKAFEQEKARRDLEKTVESLSRKYGDAFDADEVIAKALATGNSNLEAVYKQTAFDRIFEQSLTASQLKAKKAEEEQAIVQAKREATVVSKGASAKSADVSSKPVTTLRDAFELAKRQING